MAKTKVQVDQGILKRVNSVFNDVKNNSNAQESLNQPYNLFTMWDMSENDHTKLLLSLLRFKQGNEYVLIKSFMKRFADEIEILDNQQVEIYYNRKYVYYQRKDTEKKTETCNSFIDGLILIKDTNNKKNNRAIIVENKIKDAPDQPNQVRRYIYHMLKQENIELEKIWCFYIASDGSKSISEDSYTPSYEEENNNPNILSLKINKDSTESDEKVVCYIGNRFIELNYKYDITSWLREDILDKRIYPESLTSIARAYLESLEKDLFNAKPYEDLYQTILNAIKHSKSSTPNGDNNPSSVDDLLKEMDESDFKTLYALYDKVSSEQDKKKETDEDSSNLEELRRGIKSLISKIEQDAFDEFERCSVEILNQKYSDKLCEKGLKWQAKHRGLSGEKGFIQLRLNNGWTDAHLEWIPINTTMMYTATKYTLTLHVENNKGRKEQIKNKLELKGISTSKSCIYKEEFQFDRTPTSLAKMSPNDLREFLSKVYNEEGIIACCDAIIDTEQAKNDTEIQ